MANRASDSPYFTVEHDAFRAEVRRFLDAEVAPFADTWEAQGCVPRETWRAFGNRGLLGLHYPLEVGGAGRDFFHSVVLFEELGRTGYAGVRGALSVHAYMATHYLHSAGSAGLKERYLVPAIRGEKVAALGITEPGAGSDLGRIETTAVRDGDDYVVDGTKTFITNGSIADFVTLLVRTSAPRPEVKRGATGLSLLVVDRGVDGMSATRQKKVGWHSSDAAELRFRGARVPAANLIGKQDYGFMYLMQGFQLERLVAATLAVGGAERCLGETSRHLVRRHAFGASLGKLQAVRHRVADLATDLEAARQLVYHAAWAHQRSTLTAATCSMAKLKATEVAARIAHECLQLHGASGYLDDSAVARAYRDAPVGTVAGGASEVMRDIIAQALLDERPGSDDA